MHKVVRIIGWLCLLGLVTLGLMATSGCPDADRKAKASRWNPNVTVETIYGKVKGYLSSADTYGWKAIPYAKAPVGQLRWKAPQSPAPWTGVRAATTFCDSCSQFNLDASAIVGKDDCLYLNLWRPKSEETALPVYVWIHGGGNSFFTASMDRLDGVNMAGKGNMVVVTLNFRLGILGWFTHPALRNGKNPQDDSGNYGTLDIIKALEWVRDNIAAFGGDPGNVTIAGESGGGQNVRTLLVSPIAARLFHKAVIESAGGDTSTLEKGDAHANRLIERLLVHDRKAADTAAAKALREKMSNPDIEKYLRSKSITQLMKEHEILFGAMIKFPNCFTDGSVIHKNGFDAFDVPENYNQVPLMMGSNKDEIKLFMGLGPYFDMLEPENYERSARVESEKWRMKAVDNLAQKISAYPSQPAVYAYRFDYGAYHPDGYNAWPTDHDGVNYALRFGAAHALEISFFWGNSYYYSFTDIIFREDNRKGYEALTDAMMSYLARFVKTGNPQDAGGVMWEPWSNKPLMPKRILLDADNKSTIIKMANR